MRLSDFSIKRPVFTTVIMILVILLGVVSLMKIPLKLIPDINPPVAVVVTSYPGASPTEIVEKVTKPLESSLSTLQGIKNITSTASEGSNFILMEFSWTTKIDEIQPDVLQRMESTALPDDANKPQFLKFDPSQFPIIQMSLLSDGNQAELQKLSAELEQDLTTVEGVANVQVAGSREMEVVIELQEDKLKKHNLTQNDVVQLIQANNISMPGEPVNADGLSLTTRIVSTFTSIKELKELVLTINPLSGDKITVDDVASVKEKPQETGTITRANDKPAMLMSVLQQSDANTADVSKEFQDKLKELLQEDRYAGIETNVLFDQGDYIGLAIGNIGNSLIIGGLLAMLVLFVFLRNVRSPLIIGVAIPYSVIVTFVLMFFADFDLNIMTLGALALGIGMLVDNAIVVLENIYRHLSMGKDKKQAARDGAKEVGGAITASTLTTIAVFLPVVFISGILGQIFKEFAFTISFSLIASLVVALTVIPMLASIWLKLDKKPETGSSSMLIARFDRSIRWTLNHRVMVLSIAAVLLIGSALGITRVGSQFLPPTDEGYFNINLELENGTALEETNKVVQEIERELAKENEVEVYVSQIGTNQENAFRGTGTSNIAEIAVKLNPLEERNKSVFVFIDEVKPKILKAARGQNATAEVTINAQSAAGTSPQTLVFNVRDGDSARLSNSVEKIQGALKDVDNVTEVTTDREDMVKEVQINVKRGDTLAAGLTPVQVATAVNNATRGVTATQIINENEEVRTVYVRYDDKFAQNVEQLRQIVIKTPAGNYLPLEQLATIEEQQGPVSINRINQQGAVQFTVKYAANTNLGDISQAVDEKLDRLKLSDETIITFGGDRDLLESSIDDMVLALLLAIVLVYIVMAAQYESFKYPFVIMFTVPLSMIGVALALTFTGTPVSIPAVIGILILVGIVVNNAIVIVDYIIQNKEKGYNSQEAIIEATKVRVRPILMTALTTILGLVPLAIGIGGGTEINQPMGIVVIGGLLSSTFLTLYIIPVVYSFFDRDTRKWRNKNSM